jgi:hypothetical protein
VSQVACFLIEPTSRVRQTLRRYTRGERWDEAAKCYIYDNPCPLTSGVLRSHDTETLIEDAPVVADTREGYEGYLRNGSCGEVERYADDPRWPTHCACGYPFTNEDTRQVFCEEIYRRADTGEEYTLRDAPAGAMWYAPWVAHFFRPQLPGGPLVVKLPDGTDWQVDSMANNCTMKDDWKQERHHCWVIEGTPPLVSVGKSGSTCGAGAGSIATSRYHGFLRNGMLESC